MSVFRALILTLYFLALSLPEAAITRFEFVEEPNDGNSLITDTAGQVGPTALGSFTYTLESTPADIRIMNQFENTPVFTADNIIIEDIDEGIATNQDIPLFEGLTWLYLFARNPIGNGGGAPWELGPLTFTGGADLNFIVDQGPPARPNIGGFVIQGGRTQNLPSNDIRNFFTNSSPSNQEVLLEVFFNRVDVDIPGTSLELTFVGTVVNNPSIFDNDPDAQPNPNPVTTTQRPESNATVAAQLGRILSGFPPTGPPLLVEFVGDVTTFTGPSPLAVALIDRSAGLASPNITPARTGPALGEFSALGFDFKTIPDGDYEIIVGARDAAHGNTSRGLSPGAFNAFGTLTSPTAGIPTRILVRKDTIAPQAVIIQRPESVFIFGNTPPSVDPPFEDSIFSVRGTVGNERREPARVHIYSQDSPNNDGIANAGPFNNRVILTDPNSGQFDDIVDATNFLPVSSVPLYNPASQVAYRFLYVPEDTMGNANVQNIAQLFVIKDYAPPPTPTFTNLNTGDSITERLFTIRATAPQDVNSPLAEHGRVDFFMEIFRLTSSGIEGIQTFTIPASSAGQPVASQSPLDDAFVAASQTLVITDPQGVPTGAIVTVNFPDATNRFANLIPERFDLQRIVNFENIPDGILRINLCLLDQVGNRSNPCTSVDVLKDLTGPEITLGLQDSGPDDNYRNFPNAPNFTGADDNEFLVSLKSPEFTVDPVAITTSDPSYRIAGISGPEGLALKLRGRSREEFGFTTSIRITGVRIPVIELQDNVTAPGGTDISVDFQGFPFLVEEPPFARAALTGFEANIPLLNLIEGVEEFIQIRARDNLGNLGPTQSISIIRDVIPPAAPVLQAPAPLPGTTLPVLYANANTTVLQGTSEPGARGIVLLPPPNSPPGFNITSSMRIPRTTPGAIPIPGSLLDSTASVCQALRCAPFTVNSEGVFRLETLDISTVANSLSTPTIIYVQMIDSFDNTDPDFSVRPIEIHKNDSEAPLNKLILLQYPSDGERVQLFPDSTIANPWTTVFYSFQLIPFEVEAFFPMRKAPDLRLQQSNFVFKQAAKVPSVFPLELGTFTFRYLYEVESTPFSFDGTAIFEVSGGEDFFGNPVARTTGLALIVDTVAPNARTKPPQIILSPTDALLMTTMVSTRVNFDDFFKDQLSTQFASGLATSALRIDLFGPLQSAIDSTARVQLVTFVPSEPGFDLAARPAQALATDGTYRFEYLGVDRVGNQAKFTRTFFLDRQPISEPLFITNPADGARVSTMPIFPLTQGHNVLTIFDFDTDYQASDFEIRGPDNLFLGSTKSIITSQQSIFRSFDATSLPKSDGSSDGLYQILMRVFDTTGNLTQKTHTYLYDTLAPEVVTVFPSQGSCTGLLPFAQLSLRDRAGRVEAISGLDRQSSRLQLQLLSPWPGTNSHIPGTVLTSTTRFVSEDATGSATQVVALELNGFGKAGLPQDGSHDGIYSLSGNFYDKAGNASSHATTLQFDSLNPTVSVSDLRDLLFATSQTFQFHGTVADRGCGLIQDNLGNFDAAKLNLSIFSFNPDTQQVGALLLTTSAVQIDRVTPADFPAETDQGRFTFRGITPVIPAFPGQPAQALFRFSIPDKGGNLTKVDRVLRLNPNTIPVPKRQFPLSVSQFRGTTVSTYTSSPQLFLKWEAVAEAKEYILHLSRESQSPGDRTTLIRLGPNVLQYSADYTYVSSSGQPVGFGNHDELYWIVEAIDASNQGSPLIQFVRGEKITFDSRAQTMDLTQVFLSENGVYLPPSHPDTFASSAIFEFVWQTPEIIRIQGSETVFVRFERDGTIIYPLSQESWPVETGLLSMRFAMPAGKINGQAILHIQGFADPAGNQLKTMDQKVFMQVPFKVDKGPEYAVRIFKNPVDPLEYRFVFKGIDWDGRDDFLRYIPGVEPRLVLSQAMRQVVTMAELLPLQLVQLGSGQYTRGVAGGFRLDPRFLGDMRFQISAQDTRGRSMVDTVFLHVSAQPVANSMSRIVLGSREQAMDLSETITQPEKQETITLRNFPFVHHQDVQAIVRASGTMKLSTDCGRLLFVGQGKGGIEVPAQTIECDRVRGLSYDILSSNLNQIVLIRDVLPPKLSLSPLPAEIDAGDLEIHADAVDHESAVTSVRVRIGEETVDLNVGQAGWRNQVKLKPGKHSMEVLATDAAGNINLQVSEVEVLKPLDIETCNVYPNPVRREGYLDCGFTRTPQRLDITVHDTTGRRVRNINAFAQRRIKLELLSELPPAIANGVYFVKVRVSDGERKRQTTIKFAILR